MTTVTAAPPAGRVPQVVLVGQVPPPVHGQALANGYLAGARYHQLRLHHVAMAFSSDVADVSHFRWGKVARFPVVVVAVWWQALRGRRDALVYAVGLRNRLPLLRDAALLLLARPLFRVTVLHVHTGSWGEHVERLPRPLRPHGARAHAGVDVVNHLDETLRDESLPPPRQVRYLPYGVADPAPLGEPRPPRPAGPATTAPPTVLFLGNLYHTKGTHVLVRATALLRDRGVCCRVVLAGAEPGGDESERLHRLVGELGLDEIVELPGPCYGDDKHRRMVEADVFCFPTFYEAEAMPLVVLEAMAYGLPVVSTSWRAVPSMVVEGETGHLVEPGDVTALADRLEELIRRPDVAADLGRRGRRRFEERFALDRFVASFEEMIVEAVTCR
jgi:glycosyltransferase involved in cell wall biosynthesis